MRLSIDLVFLPRQGCQRSVFSRATFRVIDQACGLIPRTGVGLTYRSQLEDRLNEMFLTGTCEAYPLSLARKCKVGLQKTIQRSTLWNNHTAYSGVISTTILLLVRELSLKRVINFFVISDLVRKTQLCLGIKVCFSGQRLYRCPGAGRA